MSPASFALLTATISCKPFLQAWRLKFLPSLLKSKGEKVPYFPIALEVTQRHKKTTADGRGRPTKMIRLPLLAFNGYDTGRGPPRSNRNPKKSLKNGLFIPKLRALSKWHGVLFKSKVNCFIYFATLSAYLS